MLREFKPRPYQAKIIDFILSHRRGAVYAGMGMGKTSSTLCALERLKKRSLTPFRRLSLRRSG